MNDSTFLIQRREALAEMRAAALQWRAIRHASKPPAATTSPALNTSAAS